MIRLRILIGVTQILRSRLEVMALLLFVRSIDDVMPAVEAASTSQEHAEGLRHYGTSASGGSH